MADYESMTDNRPLTENQALIDAVRDLDCVELIELPEGRQVLSVPKGREVESVKSYLDEYRTAPERKRGTAKLTTLDSFILLVKRFADTQSALFASDNPAAPKLVGVLDCHESGTGSPRFGDHRAEYAFPLSDEWKRWTGTKPMGQKEFAEFIEDNIGDVLDPAKAGAATTAFVEQLEIALATPSQLMTLSKGLSVYVDSRAINKLDLSTGESQITYATEHRDAAGTPLKVPRGFVVSVPVFTGDAPYALPIRLRYRVNEGRVTWELKPHRVEKSFRHALEGACKKAQGETSLPLFYGTPES
jgi:Uncharacterized conserved protein (DUF2303).